MLTLFKFFYRNLNINLHGGLFLCLILHLYAYVAYLNTNKRISINIAEMLKDELKFKYDLPRLILLNIGYLIAYNMFMVIIEYIGKLAVQNASIKAIRQFLNIKLSEITTQEYEMQVNSIIHHNKNLLSCVKNLFIEFPRKAVACYHFIYALYELSWTIMIYCIVVSITFTLISLFLSYLRQKLVNVITLCNTKFNVIASEITNGIQSYKVDKRLEEYESEFDSILNKIQHTTGQDSLMVGLSEVSNGISSQIMIGLVSYMCRPEFISGTLTLKQLLYGIHSSSRFVEKLVGVVDYFGDIICKYKSFDFFNELNLIPVESNCKENNISTISFNNLNKFKILPKQFLAPYIFHLRGVNSSGRTTLLLKLLGVAYKGAMTNGSVKCLNEENKEIIPEQYRHTVGFVQQMVPRSNNSLYDYVRGVANLNIDEPVDVAIYNAISYFVPHEGYQIAMLQYFTDPHKKITNLSAGHAKMVQIIATLVKCYVQNLNIIVLDEPSNNLDFDSVKYLIEIMKGLKRNGLSIFLVTHDQRLLFDPEIVTVQL